ncbi:MAG: VOC family protein [Blastocatellia bacterium]|nr:VOC family protein [Blastocatellia bacterium]
MIHVPDVRATVEWYASIGFTVTGTHEDESDGNLDWASLSFGTTEIMLDEGGRPSSQHRREVDLYVHTEDVAAVYRRLKDRVEIVEPLHDTVYGMCEFIIRDLNRFWITFGQPAGRQ